jgi:hypothetical protein
MLFTVAEKLMLVAGTYPALAFDNSLPTRRGAPALPEAVFPGEEAGRGSG